MLSSTASVSIITALAFLYNYDNNIINNDGAKSERTVALSPVLSWLRHSAVLISRDCVL